MSGFNIFKGMTDEYDRNARLYPAFLVALPFLVGFLSVITFDEVKTKALIGLVSFLGIFYLASSISRDLGAKAQEKLVKKWGAMPSTELLRHSDSRLDIHTKAICHSRLGQGVSKTYPTVQDEQLDSFSADELYRAGVKWLIGQTRDTSKFNLLFKANIAYGYRRNAYGLRWLGVAGAMATLVYEVLSVGVIRVGPTPSFGLGDIPSGVALTMTVALVMTAVWIFYFTEETVRSAGFTYSERLLECCGQV